jgi:hypothetical protein
MPGQPMLSMAEEDFCYQCHGGEDERSRMIHEGRLAAATPLSDVEREFQKAYRHPVVEGTGHNPVELLPSFSKTQPSHSECVDCHNPHQRVVAGKTLVNEVQGYSLSGQHLETSLREYEICLKCHSDAVGFGKSERILTREFSTGARSQHPVTTGATGGKLASLSEGLGSGQSMNCSDCHRSDDPGAPKGPHGSNHRFLLSGNYSLEAFSEESPYAYEFCYSCHDRFSILANESFSLHREHIVGDAFSGRTGTSCFTCHASHGSFTNDHLIQFNPQAVSPEETTRRLEYVGMGEGSGQCYLKCHGYDHGPGEY